MEYLEIILIGVALSMDACAITIANCATHKKNLNGKKEWLMPIAFAFFQGLMPLIGYLLGSLFAEYVAGVSKFITAGIFLFLAIKIVIDIFKEKKECSDKDKTCTVKKFTIWLILLQAVATSIDALAVGVTFISLSISVYIAVILIVVVTFILVSAALLFGKTLGKIFGSYAEWVGAGILFVLAIKSLVEALI